MRRSCSSRRLPYRRPAWPRCSVRRWGRRRRSSSARGRARCPRRSCPWRSVPGRQRARATSAWWRLPLALVVSLALQVGVNYANDYSDGVRGTDDAGSDRCASSPPGWPRRRAVKRAAFIALRRRCRRRAGRSPRPRRGGSSLVGAASIARGLVLHRWPSALRLRRARRAVRLRVLRARRDGRHDLRRRRAPHRAEHR